MASTVRIRRRDFRANVAGWVVGLVILAGVAVLLASVAGDGHRNLWLFLVGTLAMMALVGYLGWRRGEFTPTVVTFDDTGVDVVATPASTSWALPWDAVTVGLVRDGLDVPYVVFEPADGLEHGTRTMEERKLAMVLRLPVHVRSLRLTDELRAALTPHLPEGLTAYRA